MDLLHAGLWSIYGGFLIGLGTGILVEKSAQQGVQLTAFGARLEKLFFVVIVLWALLLVVSGGS